MFQVLNKNSRKEKAAQNFLQNTWKSSIKIAGNYEILIGAHFQMILMVVFILCILRVWLFRMPAENTKIEYIILYVGRLKFEEIFGCKFSSLYLI